jgi:hypothetical protein
LLRGNARADDDRDEQAGAEELGEQPRAKTGDMRLTPTS